VSHQIVKAVYLSEIPRSLRFLAVTLATFADVDGGSVYPSVDTLMAMMRRKERVIREGLAELRHLGFIVVESGTRLDHDSGAVLPKGGQGQTTRYRFELTAPVPLTQEGNTPRQPSREGCTPVQGSGNVPGTERVRSSAPKGALFDTEPCTPAQPKGALFDTEGCTPVQGIHHDPSVDPSDPPRSTSGKITARAGDAHAEAAEPSKPTDADASAWTPTPLEPAAVPDIEGTARALAQLRDEPLKFPVKTPRPELTPEAEERISAALASRRQQVAALPPLVSKRAAGGRP
jgi:hypothetical protein